SGERGGSVVGESRTEVRDGSRLSNCILLRGAVVSGSHENRIVGPDYTISLSEADMQPALHAAEKKRVALSDPLFASHFRISSAKAPAAAFASDSPAWSDAILIGL